LPDDILYLILEEVYEERYDSIAEEVSLEVVTILINKRIFSLAQPIWFRRLSINESQLDLRLSHLHLDDVRRNALRHLSIAFTGSYLHLFLSILLRLPRLTHLAFQVSDDFDPHMSPVAMTGIASLAALKHLRLQFAGSSEHSSRMWTDYDRAKPGIKPHMTLEARGGLFYDVKYTQGAHLRSLKCRPNGQQFSRSTWPHMFAAEFIPRRDKTLSWDDDILKSFQEAVADDVCSNLSAKHVT